MCDARAQQIYPKPWCIKIIHSKTKSRGFIIASIVVPRIEQLAYSLTKILNYPLNVGTEHEMYVEQHSKKFARTEFGKNFSMGVFDREHMMHISIILSPHPSNPSNRSR